MTTTTTKLHAFSTSVWLRVVGSSDSPVTMTRDAWTHALRLCGLLARYGDAQIITADSVVWMALRLRKAAAEDDEYFAGARRQQLANLIELAERGRAIALVSLEGDDAA